MANIRQVRRKMNYNAHPEFHEKRPEQLIRAQAAKIIECPRNVIELRKLLNTWDDIDKAKRRVMSKLSGETYMLKLKYRELLTGENSGSTDDTLLLPPGFRYHANGEPKKVNKRRFAKSKFVETGSQNGSVDVCEISSVHMANQDTEGTDAIDKDIKTTAKLLQETDADRKLHAINRKLSKVKGNLSNLRAKSADSVARPITKRTSPTRRTGTRSTKQCEACFTRLKWSEHEVRPSRGSRDNLGRKPWSSSTRITPNSTPPNTGRSKTSSMDFTSPPGPSPRKAWSKDSPSPRTSACKAVTMTDSKISKVEKPTPGNSKEVLSKYTQQPHKAGSLNSKLLETVTKSDLGFQTQSAPTMNVRESSSQTIKDKNVSKTKDMFKISSSSEDCYRWVMRRSGISDRRKLETMSDMFEKAGLVNKEEASSSKKSSQCHIQVTHKSVPHIGKKDAVQAKYYTEALAARRNRLELETKCSNAKVEEFLRRLPTPDVTIRRWRTSNGHMQVINRRCATPTPPGDDDDNDESPNTDSAPGGGDGCHGGSSHKDAAGRASHGSESDADGQDSSDSESLAINTSLTSWPTHWAQRVAFLSRSQQNEETSDQDDNDPVKEFKKLARCRYLRIPQRVISN